MITIIGILFAIWLVKKAFTKQDKTNTKKNGKIETELIPFQMQYINVRSRVDEPTWIKITRVAHELNTKQFKIRKGTCEVCGSNGRSQGFQHPLEAHEEWQIDQSTKTQKLTRIRSLCPFCHKAIHFGLAEKQGYGEKIKMHMMRVNGWTRNQVDEHIRQSRLKVKQFNEQYMLDLTLLNQPPYSFAHSIRFTKNETNNCNPRIKH